MTRIDITIDVTDVVTLDATLETAVSIYLPDSHVHGKQAKVLFAFPGGTFSRAYYDLDVPGRAGYSLAKHLSAAGYIVVCCDHIGIGDSTPYEPFRDLTKDIVVAADNATVTGVLAKLSNGEIFDRLPPVEDPFIIGIGHSMGASILIEQQANWRPFHAVALLGYSLLELPQDKQSNATEFAAALSGLPDLTRPPRSIFRKWFHDESVPPDVIAADDALAVRVYPWVFERARTSVTEAAQHLDVPIFLCFGAQDASPDPLHEPTAYRKSTDVTAFILSNSAHCHNFAKTREYLFDRLAGWGCTVSSVYDK